MCLHHPSDGCLLDDRSTPSTHHIHDANGRLILISRKVPDLYSEDCAASTGRDVNRGGGDQLPELDQLHVPWWSHHGDSRGALWSSQQGCSQNNYAGEQILKG